MKILDPVQTAPSLELQQSWWAMIGLGENGQEWSMEQKFEKIAEAGYGGISAAIPSEAEQDEWHRLLDRYRLNFSAMVFPSCAADLAVTLHAAARFGRVQYVNAQVMDSFVIDRQAERLLTELGETAEDAKVPFFVETHRGTVTQDLIRTSDYVRALPGLRLTIDLSHYVVAGELNGSMEKAEPYFEALLRRTSGLHARVSNGEQIQIDIGAEGTHPMLGHYKRWWGQAMSYWLDQAAPGEVLPFVTELGPPGYYAVTRTQPDGGELEISDRWQQALLFKRMAEGLWTRILDNRR